jgi:peptide/nickel transport system permease protein
VSTQQHDVDVIAAAAIDAGSAVPLDDLPVRARGYWEGVWRRFRRDRVALAGGAFIVLLLVTVFAGAPLAAWLLGHGPDDLYTTAVTDLGLPVGPWSHVTDYRDPGKSVFLLLGADSTVGHDEFLRLLYGGQVSLEVALGATLFTSLIGMTLGAVAGYYGGWVDAIVSRATELTMAFPFLLFAIALASTVGHRLDSVTLGFLGEGVVTLIVIFSVFGWFYPARIVRSVTLSLREKEFVEAARMVGAGDWRIVRSHVLPHLVGPMIVYSTIAVAGFILAEAGLSFLGLGIPVESSSWGNLLQTSAGYYLTQPWLMLWPGAALLLTTLAFNLLGDGLRDAFDPRSSR